MGGFYIKPLLRKNIITKLLFFNLGKVIGEKSYTSWDAFVKQNEERIKK